MQDFIQDGPVLRNQFEDDFVLKSFIECSLPSPYLKEVSDDLKRFGERVINDVLLMAKSAEAHPPSLVQFDTWGNRVDNVIVDQGWTDLHAVSAEESIVRLGYERKYAEYSRMVQFAKLYLFHPSSAFYSCPLAMTDGAAKLIELYGDEELRKKTFAHLISCDPQEFWTSGQWMTEKTGGSDVSHTETIARFIDGEWKLFGTKWFTSAVTSQMAMALARIEDSEGNTIKGSRGLSLFYVEMRNSQGALNNLEVIRLKEKLGTKALPTAEIKLHGTNAKLVGKTGEGVKQIAAMFNVTRLYNSVTSVAAFRRILTLAEDYSTKRSAFHKTIDQHPLNASLLREARSEFRGCFYFTFKVAEIFGNEEVFKPHNKFELNHDELGDILRLLTPVLKLYTAKKTVIWTSELLEVFGGVGYIEDSGIPLLYRDNQVFSLWEGTTNVLSLDLLRAMKKDQSWDLLMKFMTKELSRIKKEKLIGLKKETEELLVSCDDWVKELLTLGDESLESAARKLAFRVGDLAGAISWLSALNNQSTQEKEEEEIRLFTLFLKRCFSLCRNE